LKADPDPVFPKLTGCAVELERAEADDVPLWRAHDGSVYHS
jgi:hypothetical protein